MNKKNAILRRMTLRDMPGLLRWGAVKDSRLEHYSFRDFDEPDIESWYYAKQRMLTRKLYGLFVEDRPIGFITLKKINVIYRTAEIGLAINPDEQCRGYGERMVREMLSHVYAEYPIDTVYLDVAEFNQHARRLYEKCGFMYIGGETKAYEHQANKRLAFDFPETFELRDGTLFTDFLRMSHTRLTRTAEAHAKINLGLRVGRLRDDGYHELTTMMQTVDLCDLVHLRPAKRDDGGRDAAPQIRICSELGGVPSKKNLAYLAAEAFLRRYPLPSYQAVEISLYKRIPMGAGMGGGSADAAAVLRLLNDISGSPATAAELHDMALSVGSDVPFCLGRGAAVATGRGELLQPVTPGRILHLLVCLPESELSTPAVFRELDRLREGDRSGCAEGKMFRRTDSLREDRAEEEDPQAARAGAAAERSASEEVQLFAQAYAADLSLREMVKYIPPNDMEAAANSLLHGSYSETSEVERNVECLLGAGAVYAAMSGSGPAVYGIFESRAAAKAAKESVRSSVYCETLRVR